jgi:hypothetical protein
MPVLLASRALLGFKFVENIDLAEDKRKLSFRTLKFKCQHLITDASFSKLFYKRNILE